MEMVVVILCAIGVGIMGTGLLILTLVYPMHMMAVCQGVFTCPWLGILLGGCRKRCRSKNSDPDLEIGLLKSYLKGEEIRRQAEGVLMEIDYLKELKTKKPRISKPPRSRSADGTQEPMSSIQEEQSDALDEDVFEVSSDAAPILGSEAPVAMQTVVSTQPVSDSSQQ
uniref:Rh167 n=1 Tax=Rhesus cytomegalovirus (strain 68-1) TaxID=47929 RepID=A7LBI6_RHCM6|nr:rh167 [macacine betaherpesvirus 3]